MFLDPESAQVRGLPRAAEPHDRGSSGATSVDHRRRPASRITRRIISVITLCASVGSAVAGEKPDLMAPSPAALELRYEGLGDLISVRARAARLGEVLREISRATALTIDCRDPELLDERVSIDIERASLERAIGQLLGAFNTALSYSAEAAGADLSRGRLQRVVLLSRKSGASPMTDAVGRPSSAADEPAKSRDPAPPSSEALVRYLLGNRFAAREIVDFLTRSADAALKAQAEEALVQILGERDFRLYGPAVDVLKELAPEKAIAALSPWLGTSDRQMRVVAAATLGLIENDGSVEALTAALAGDDPVTRQAAASSLAQIRTEAASAALLHAYLSGDERVRRPIAVAIASHGHPTAQAALAVVSASPVSKHAPAKRGADWPNSNERMAE